MLLLPLPASARRYASRSGYGGGGGGGTVFGSSASGMGNLIRAEGAYNQSTAQAMVALEQAKSAQMANRLKAAQTYYQLRRLNEQEQAEQARRHAALYGEVPPPKILRLSASQLDPVTGAITWHPLLQGAEFQPERSKVDHLFADRATLLLPVTVMEVGHLVDHMRDKLDAQHDDLPTADFFAARHFLEAVAAETHPAPHAP
jgi:hypothetical protein